MKKKRGNRKTGAIELEVLAWWIIAFAILFLVLFGYLIISGKMSGISEYIKNLFRFRG